MKEGDIWSNVIIIVKQTVNPKYDAFSDKQREIIHSDSSVREVMNVMTEVEIRDILNNKLRNIEDHLQ